ncbi:MAG TPA: trypsin-like serine protease [Casimicrobiaceae bacterium]|jgi:hypothetical protein|nr:trypsin-like serine protease [Casimicrobiaceae bacterium]
MARIRTFALLLATLALAGAVDAAPINAVPPAVSTTPVTAAAKSQSALLLQGAVSALTIALPAPSESELATTRSLPLTGMRMKPMPIGFGRDVPAAERTIALGSLSWQGTADGGRAAQIVVTSPGAVGLRVALQMAATDPDIVIRLKGDDPHAVAIGPIAANELAQSTAKFGEWWSPILEGSHATIEISVSAAVDVSKVTMVLSRVSHLTQAGTMLSPSAHSKATGIGGSGACERDWKCEVQSPALVNAANAVGRMVFTESDGSSFLCTGTLLNDSIASQTPYFFTADHCIDSVTAAATLEVYWFYDSVGCSTPDDPTLSQTAGDYFIQHGGSTLLGRSVAQDWAMVRLNQPPPANTVFSAWNATPISTGTVIDLHHPEGDLKKYSQGDLSGYAHIVIDDDNGDPQINGLLARVFWGKGVTEGGSSGSGLLTLNVGGGFYEVRGGLTGGASSCDSPNSADYFTRFDQMMPTMRDYLAPGTGTPNEAVVVEYYDQALNHYFITQSPIEINDLDTGVVAGWQRTGLRFLAYTAPVSGASPVCRAYLPDPYGNTHFYSALPSECALLGTSPQFIHWVVESSNVFYAVIPDTASGACPTGTHAVWRFFNASTGNHRYTDDQSIHDILHADPAWSAEGYGPDAVNLCAPNGQ